MSDSAGALASGGAPATGASAPASGAPRPSVPAPRSKDSRVTDGPPAGGTPEASAAPDFKGTKHKVKIDQDEQEVDYDELKAGYQRAQSATRRYEEAARLRAETKKVEEALEQGDISFLVKKMGPDKARHVMESYLIEQMEYDELPPTEKELRAERKRREELEATLADRDKDATSQREQEMSAKAYQDLDVEVSEALKTVGKRASPRMALRIIEEIEARGLNDRGERISAGEALGYADASMRQDVLAFVEDLSAEEAMKVLPKAFIDRLMKHRVGEVVDMRGQRREAPQAQGKESQPKKRSIDDAYAELDQKFSKKGR